MPDILVRDVDLTAMEGLRKRAVRNGRALVDEARAILSQAAADETRAGVERVRALFAGRTFTDSAALLRGDRER